MQRVCIIVFLYTQKHRAFVNPMACYPAGLYHYPAGRGSQVEKVAPFLDLTNLKPFVDSDLADSTKPVVFYGFSAVSDGLSAAPKDDSPNVFVPRG